MVWQRREKTKVLSGRKSIEATIELQRIFTWPKKEILKNKKSAQAQVDEEKEFLLVADDLQALSAKVRSKSGGCDAEKTRSFHCLSRSLRRKFS